MPFDLTTTLLVLIAVLLVLVVIVLFSTSRSSRTLTYNLQLDPKFRNEMDGMLNGIRHAADISAVLGLLDQLEENPDAVALLQNYPETVRAAAWLHYINRLGSDLQHAQSELSNAHQSNYAFPGTKEMAITSAQSHVDKVRSKLDTAIKASGIPARPHAV